MELFEHRLANGLRVVLAPRHGLPVVMINVRYDVGSSDEKPGQHGFAHLFEHFMFEGSEHLDPGEHIRIIESLGGSYNAHTWYDETCYFERLPSGALEMGLWLEAERMANLTGSLRQACLDAERDIVKNERRQNYENVPYGFAGAELFEMLFAEGHPYRHDTIGVPADLDAATLETVVEFWDAFYSPDNAVLVVAGDLDVEHTIALIERHFGSIPGRLDPLHAGRAGERADLPSVIERIADVPRDRVYVAAEVAPFADPGDVAARVLAAVLSADGGLLQTTLVTERRLAEDIVVWHRSLAGAGVIVIESSSAEGVDPGVLASALHELLDQVADGAVSADEVERAVARVETAWAGNVGTLEGLAESLGEWLTLRGDLDGFLDNAGRIRSTDVETVRAMAAHLHRDRRATLIYRRESP